MKSKKLLNGFYNYTVVLTYIGMLFGLFGIVCAIEGNFRNTVIFLMCAGICDMFDGAIASTRERNESEKRFGIQIDSLSDLICFGVLPAMYVYMASERNKLTLVCGGLYVLCALIRLAYYNVCEEERQQQEDGSRKAFSGLPVTAAAIVYPLMFIIVKAFDLSGALILPTIAAVMAVAFVLTFKLKKPQLIGKLVLVAIGISEFVILIGGFGIV